MICPKCHGTGWITYKVLPRIGEVKLQGPKYRKSDFTTVEGPCSYPGCVNGIIHCCDGLVEEEGKRRVKMVTQKVSHPINLINMESAGQIQEAHNLLNECLSMLSDLQKAPDMETSKDLKKKIRVRVIDLMRGLDQNDMLRKEYRKLSDKKLYSMQQIP